VLKCISMNLYFYIDHLYTTHLPS